MSSKYSFLLFFFLALVVAYFAIYLLPSPPRKYKQTASAISSFSLNQATVAGQAAISGITAQSASSTLSNTVSQRVFEYKVMKEVDPCDLVRMGSQGYQAIQFGGTMEDQSYGYDENCKNPSIRADVLDWVVFMREKNPVN